MKHLFHLSGNFCSMPMKLKFHADGILDITFSLMRGKVLLFL